MQVENVGQSGSEWMFSMGFWHPIESLECWFGMRSLNLKEEEWCVQAQAHGLKDKTFYYDQLHFKYRNRAEWREQLVEIGTGRQANQGTHP